jgi:uncharacterized membrane protein
VLLQECWKLQCDMGVVKLRCYSTEHHRRRIHGFHVQQSLKPVLSCVCSPHFRISTCCCGGGGGGGDGCVGGGGGGVGMSYSH